MTPCKESELLPIVAAFLRQRSYLHQETELPFYGYRIDLYAVSPSSEAVAIELKLKDWRRALDQALIYQLCADLVSLALPSQVCSRVDKDQLRRHGIGLLAVSADGGCTELLPAVHSSFVKASYRDFQIGYCRQIANARSS